jgi:hypothetical protein
MEDVGTSAMVGGTGRAVHDILRFVNQSPANRPVDVQLELISGRGDDDFLIQTEPV